MKLIWVTEAEIIEGYLISVTFNDGCRKIYDCRQLFNDGNPAYGPLKNMDIFSNIALDGWTVTWNNGTIDVAPEFLYEHGNPIE